MFVSDKESVLLIEDDANDQMLMARAFRANGAACDIQMLANSWELQAYMSGEGKYSDRSLFPHPSLIITDLNSANLDGLAALTRLKQHPEWSRIPVVVLSGSDNPRHIEDAMILGANSYFVKPLDFHELRSLLKTLQARWLNSMASTVCSNAQVNT